MKIRHLVGAILAGVAMWALLIWGGASAFATDDVAHHPTPVPTVTVSATPTPEPTATSEPEPGTFLGVWTMCDGAPVTSDLMDVIVEFTGVVQINGVQYTESPVVFSVVYGETLDLTITDTQGNVLHNETVEGTCQRSTTLPTPDPTEPSEPTPTPSSTSRPSEQPSVKPSSPVGSETTTPTQPPTPATEQDILAITGVDNKAGVAVALILIAAGATMVYLRGRFNDD